MHYYNDNLGWDILIISKLLEGYGHVDPGTGKLFVWLNGLGEVEVTSTLQNVLEELFELKNSRGTKRLNEAVHGNT